LSKEVVKKNTALTNHTDELNSEKDNLKTLTKKLESLERSLQQKSKDLEAAQNSLAAKERECVVQEREVEHLQSRYQNAFAGLADYSSSSLVSLPEQIAILERKEREATSHAQQATLKINHMKDTLKELRKALKTQQSAHDAASKEKEVLRSKVTQLENEISGTRLDEALEVKLKARANELKNSSENLRDQFDSLSATIEARLNFDYKDPERDFDRSRVKGLVARLFKVNDRKTSTAIEIAAGAKLYQVIVDTELTGKLLLQKGQLKKRVTILPLNKVSSRCIDASKIQRAQQIAASRGGVARLALDLVTFDESVRKAMEFTFGSVIVCDTSDIAKTIAYDKSIMCRTVTLEGDSFDPSGTVTGGSTGQIGVLLAKIDEFHCVRQELSNQVTELSTITQQLRELEAHSASFREAMTQLELKKHELQLITDKHSSSSYSQTANEIQILEAKLQAQEDVSYSFEYVYN